MLAWADEHLGSPYDALIPGTPGLSPVQVRGVTQGHLVGLTLKGVGYRVEPADDARPPVGTGFQPYYDHVSIERTNISYPVPDACKALRFKARMRTHTHTSSTNSCPAVHTRLVDFLAVLVGSLAMG